MGMQIVIIIVAAMGGACLGFFAASLLNASHGS